MREEVVVTVNEGKVRGFKTKTKYSGVEFYSFLGVPYAEPPTGTARFKDPAKVKPWNNVLDATVEKQGCIQYSLFKKCVVGSEDCLYNNIYTPKIPSKGDPVKAVIVCIHPGAMFHGSPDPSSFGSPDYIMHRDIVYICIGYRLQAFGLLNLNLNDCAGNQAIKDMILSLQWIKENIHVFGGDSRNVTLMGSSSGSFFVHLLLLSPSAKGLYHKAILMGSYVFNPLNLNSSENILVADELARTMGYNGELCNSKELLHYYRKLDSITIVAARVDKYKSQTTLQAFPSSPFMPAADHRENSPLLLSPKELIPAMNRVPVLIGFCQHEGAMALAFLQHDQQSIAELFYTALRQNCWGWGAELSDTELKSIQKEVENYYLNGQLIETASKLQLCNIITDAALSGVYDSLINPMAKDLPSSVFVYNFHYDGNLDGMKVRFTEMMQTEIKGPFHAADYLYWNYIADFAGEHMEKIKPADRQIIDTLTSLFTTFAKTNNPNYRGLSIDWKPTTPEHPSHLIINETLESRDEVLNGERLEFWHNLKKKYQKNSNNS